MHKGKELFRISLGVVGEHNVSNATGVAVMALGIGISTDDISEGLKSFTGTERRFEKKGEYKGVTIIDDYAHHPTEMTATLKAAKLTPHKNLWVVFQPHTYSRTLSFKDEICEALSLADKVILTDIYAAREKDPGMISSKNLADIIGTVFKDKAIAGRTGGDEFYVFVPECTEDTAAIFKKQFYFLLSDINNNLDKPYDLSASFGTFVHEITPAYNVEELLRIADERMYAEKQQKRAHRT